MPQIRELLEPSEASTSKSVTVPKGDTDAATLAQLFPEQPTPSRLILPTAGMCLKTTTSGASARKVFVNVCHTDGIPPPKSISHEELAEFWYSGDAGEYRVPMSIGPPREELDNQGAPCDVYDVAINTEFFNKIESDEIFRTFFIQVAIEGVANKHKSDILLTNGVTVLKKRKSMGNIQPHRVQVRSASAYRNIIQEVRAQGVPQGPEQVSRARYVLILEPGELGNILTGRFIIPDLTVASPKDFKLLLGDDRLRIEASSVNYLVDIFIPYVLDTEHAIAIFDCQSDLLTVSVPVFIQAK